jgi:DNA-binding NarL/FixJ family response regulator/predicted nucleic acid-binding protein
VIVADTSAWVEYLRATGSPVHLRLRELIADEGDLATTEVVIMELLAGAADAEGMTRLRRFLGRFELLPVEGLADHEAAAELYRRCRAGRGCRRPKYRPARLGRGHVAVPGRGGLRTAGHRRAPGVVRAAGAGLAAHRRRGRRGARLRRAVAAPPLAGRAGTGAGGPLDLLGGGGGAMVVALLTVAVHRPPRITGRVFALSVLAALVYVVARPEPRQPWLLLFLFGVAIQGAAVGWGLFIHSRRQLIESLRDRAVRAETEARLRAEQAQQRARDEIAREMHDVLGHRLSLLSVHAGALEFRPDASPEEIAGAAKVIRENAHLRALRAGAAGFVLKDTPPAEIVDAVRRVAQGLPVLSPAVTRRLMARVAGSGSDRRARARERLALLNDREREVAVAVGQGRSNAEIGAVLFLSAPTVKTHVSSILTKLDLDNRVQIAVLAHDAGLLDEQA